MSRTRVAVAAVAAVVLALGAGAAVLPASARADGDPASDVLLGQDVFLPYSPVSAAVQQRLYAVTAAGRRAGYPLKVALISATTDLGVVPSLFGKPSSYAQFLSAELAGVVPGPVLVVMPAGFGLAVQGKPRATTALAGLPIGAGPDGLGTAAVTATERLAAAAGHPLPAGAARATAGTGAGADTIRHAVTAIAVLALLAGAAMGVAAMARGRAATREA
ncbi:MAG TPA: hypothetical protein VNR66_07520 [Solirubrobacteraceae bacterium]|nr:hypothetical protein [Solirubrobacteraceae bacterium]